MIDMSQMFLIEDVDISLYSSQKCVNLLDRIEHRKRLIKQDYPRDKPLPKMVQNEIRNMLVTILELERESHNRFARLN